MVRTTVWNLGFTHHEHVMHAVLLPDVVRSRAQLACHVCSGAAQSPEGRSSKCPGRHRDLKRALFAQGSLHEFHGVSGWYSGVQYTATLCTMYSGW